MKVSQTEFNQLPHSEPKKTPYQWFSFAVFLLSVVLTLGEWFGFSGNCRKLGSYNPSFSLSKLDLSQMTARRGAAEDTSDVRNAQRALLLAVCTAYNVVPTGVQPKRSLARTGVEDPGSR